MENTELYNFVSHKLNEKHMKMTELHKQCDIGRTMLYRYLQGQMPLPEALLDKLARALMLSGKDKQALGELAAIATVDKTMVAARSVIETGLFGPAHKPAQLEFILYEGDRYVRTSGEVFAMLAGLLDKPEARCSIRVVNCMEPRFFAPVEGLLTAVLARSAASSVEHAFAMPQSDYAYRARCFFNILRFLPRDGYRAYILEQEAPRLPSGFMGNSLFMDITYREDGAAVQQSYALTFTASGLCQCYSGRDSGLRRFFEEAFNACKAGHRPPELHVENSNYDVQSELMMKLEQQFPSYILKPDCCYHEAPPQLYQSLLDRYRDDRSTLEGLVAGLSGGGGASQHLYLIQKMIGDLAARYQTTYKFPFAGLHTTQGLRRLLATGRLSDHLDVLPPFERDEVVDTLRHLLERTLDPDDHYHMYLTDKAAPQDITICVSKGYGVNVELSDSGSMRWAYFLRDKRLADAFVDYIEHVHIPKNCLSSQAMEAFMAELLEGA